MWKRICLLIVINFVIADQSICSQSTSQTQCGQLTQNGIICQWSVVLQQCTMKTCVSLSASDCLSGLSYMRCKLNSGKCTYQGCDNITDQTTCGQYQTQIYNNVEYCMWSSKTNTCVKYDQQFECRSYLNQQSCTGNTDGFSCTWNSQNQVCDQNACFQLQQTDCEKYSVYNNQLNYQYCLWVQPQGASTSQCSPYSVVNCEDIQTQATCLNTFNAASLQCAWNNNKCTTMTCSDLNTTTCLTYQQKGNLLNGMNCYPTSTGCAEAPSGLQCYLLTTQASCNSQPQITTDTCSWVNGTCQVATCQTLPSNLCNFTKPQLVNGDYCIGGQSSCLQATCETITNVTECLKYSKSNNPLNGDLCSYVNNKCQTVTSNTVLSCSDYTNEDVCFASQDSSNDQCNWVNNTCQPFSCSQLNQTMCALFSFPNRRVNGYQCVYQNGQCNQVLSASYGCSTFNSDQTMCNLFNENINARTDYYCIYSTTQNICYQAQYIVGSQTNSQCSIFGGSQSDCNQALTKPYLKPTALCQWSGNSSCILIEGNQCSQLQNQQNCLSAKIQNSFPCFWTGALCKELICQQLNQTECSVAKTYCFWNNQITSNQFCDQYQVTTDNIPAQTCITIGGVYNPTLNQCSTKICSSQTDQTSCATATGLQNKPLNCYWQTVTKSCNPKKQQQTCQTVLNSNFYCSTTANTIEQCFKFDTKYGWNGECVSCALIYSLIECNATLSACQWANNTCVGQRPINGPAYQSYEGCIKADATLGFQPNAPGSNCKQCNHIQTEDDCSYQLGCNWEYITTTQRRILADNTTTSTANTSTTASTTSTTSNATDSTSSNTITTTSSNATDSTSSNTTATTSSNTSATTSSNTAATTSSNTAATTSQNTAATTSSNTAATTSSNTTATTSANTSAPATTTSSSSDTTTQPSNTNTTNTTTSNTTSTPNTTTQNSSNSTSTSRPGVCTGLRASDPFYSNPNSRVRCEAIPEQGYSSQGIKSACINCAAFLVQAICSQHPNCYWNGTAQSCLGTRFGVAGQNYTYKICQALGTYYGFNAYTKQCVNCLKLTDEYSCETSGTVGCNWDPLRKLCRGLRVTDDDISQVQCEALGASFAFSSTSQVHCIPCGYLTTQDQCVSVKNCVYLSEGVCVGQRPSNVHDLDSCLQYYPNYGFDPSTLLCRQCSNLNQTVCEASNYCIYTQGFCLGKKQADYNSSQCVNLGPNYAVVSSTGACQNCLTYQTQAACDDSRICRVQYDSSSKLSCERNRKCYDSCSQIKVQSACRDITQAPTWLMSGNAAPRQTCNWNNNLCVTTQCAQITNNITCDQIYANNSRVPNCYWNNGVCSPRVCTSITKQSECQKHFTQSINNQICTWNSTGSNCVQIIQAAYLSCSSYLNQQDCTSTYKVGYSKVCRWDTTKQECQQQRCTALDNPSSCVRFNPNSGGNRNNILTSTSNAGYCYWAQTTSDKSSGGTCNDLPETYNCTLFNSQVSCQSITKIECLWVSNECIAKNCSQFQQEASCLQYSTQPISTGTYCLWSSVVATTGTKTCQAVSSISCYSITTQSTCETANIGGSQQCVWNTAKSTCSLASCSDITSVSNCLNFYSTPINGGSKCFYTGSGCLPQTQGVSCSVFTSQQYCQSSQKLTNTTCLWNAAVSPAQCVVGGCSMLNSESLCNTYQQNTLNGQYCLWNTNTSACSTSNSIPTCSQITSQASCQALKASNLRACAWYNSKCQTIQCSDLSQEQCRSLNISTGLASGQYCDLVSGSCVALQNSSCQSIRNSDICSQVVLPNNVRCNWNTTSLSCNTYKCSDLVDSCLCRKQVACSYDFTNDVCTPISCSSTGVTLQQCTKANCLYDSVNKKCLPQQGSNNNTPGGGASPSSNVTAKSSSHPLLYIVSMLVAFALAI